MSDLMDVAERVLGWANDDEQVEVYAARGRETDVEVYGGEIETLSQAESQGVGVRVIKDGREGFAYAGMIDDDVLAETLAEARDNAGFAEPDEFNGLATPDGVDAPALDVYDARMESYSAEDKVNLAIEVEKAVLAADSRVKRMESSNYGDVIFESALASTTGIRGESRRTACSVSSYAIAEGDGGEAQTGFGFHAGRYAGDLDLARVARDTADRATRMLGATKPSSTRTTVVLDPFVAAQFLSILSATLNGESVLKGRSMFADRLGEEVAAPSVTLVDDPTDPRMYTAAERDAEGLASRRNPLIEGGVLRSFVHNSYSGRRAGAASTGNAVRGGFKSTPGVGCRALLLEPGTLSTDELLAQVGDGVLVQSVKGMHSGVNPISGDFSTGAEGLRITGGKLAEPLREFTIGSTLQKMLQGIVAIGADVDWLPMMAAGMPIAISDVTISGT